MIVLEVIGLEMIGLEMIGLEIIVNQFFYSRVRQPLKLMIQIFLKKHIPRKKLFVGQISLKELHKNIKNNHLKAKL